MKTILCYGDSNTWGYDPVSADRHPYERRWTTVLQRVLGEDYLVIPEGLNGRTTVWDDPIELHKSGSTYLPPCLESHKPVDLVVIMLGTNDLKMRFGLPAVDIAAGAGVLVDLVGRSACGPGGAAPKVLVLVPGRNRSSSRRPSRRWPGRRMCVCWMSAQRSGSVMPTASISRPISWNLSDSLWPMRCVGWSRKLSPGRVVFHGVSVGRTETYRLRPGHFAIHSYRNPILTLCKKCGILPGNC